MKRCDDARTVVLVTNVKESETLHKSAINPALQLLAQPHFAGANTEFLGALEDYRKGDIGDCLVKCGSAFESVLKVICDRKGWPYNQTDTASTLVKTVIANTSLSSPSRSSPQSPPGAAGRLCKYAVVMHNCKWRSVGASPLHSTCVGASFAKGCRPVPRGGPDGSTPIGQDHQRINHTTLPTMECINA